MKSIVQEASSIAKAIQEGWQRAGKPEEFTVKVFEPGFRGFLGFGSTPAKVGIFFKERVDNSKRRTQQSRDKQPRQIIQKSTQDAPMAQNDKIKKRRYVWTDDMVASAKTWITTSLKRANLTSISFSAEVDGNLLKVLFKETIYADKEKEISLFRNLAYIITGMLQTHYSREFRYLKVVLKQQDHVR
jgi:predicted RNA-binding protein Jag